MDRCISYKHQQEQELQPQVPEPSVNQEPPASTHQFNIKKYSKLCDCPLIGFGGYGRVYQYQWNSTTVAVKDIAVSDKDAPFVKRLCREGEIHKTLQNKNIIRLISTQSLPQHLLLVMEFAAGGSLGDLLKNHTSLDSNVVTDWAAQIAEGMSYLHENGVVHRDLKPSNILVLEPIDNSELVGKTIKIADFGLACDGHYATRTMSKVGGTENFMAPEVRKPPHRFSKASDVYSFGLVVWNLLTGNEPSYDLQQSFELEEELRLTLSPFNKNLLKKCCTSDHMERPTFTNILADITQYKRRNATESEGISWCKEELDSELVNFHASPSPAPAPSLQQPSQQQQQASPSRAPSPSQLNMQHSQQLKQQASSSLLTQQQQQSFSVCAASASFKLPVKSWDVALTQDGRSLLLAAEEHGLVELNTASGRELRRWRPPKHSGGLVEWVWAQTALWDRQAAVGLCLVTLVALLLWNERSSSSTCGAVATVAAAAARDEEWTEDRRVQPPWSAGGLSARIDILIERELGRRLQQLSLNSGWPLSDTKLQRDYTILSPAVTAHVLVTLSDIKVELDGRRRAPVVDAHSLDADGGSNKRLWEEEEELCGVCADCWCGCLYTAPCRSDWSSDRVSALSLQDSNGLRRVALRFHSTAAAAQLVTRRLSLFNDGAAEQQRSSSSSSSRRSDKHDKLLAALNRYAENHEVLTLRLSTNDKLQ